MSERGNNPVPIPPEDLALYALQALSAEEMAAVSAALRDNPEAQQELARIQGDLALLSLSSEQQAPPAGSFERFKARMHSTSNGVSTAATPAAATAAPVTAPSVTAAPVTTPVTATPATTPAVIEMPRRSKWAVITPWAIAAGLAIGCVTLGVKNTSLNDALNDQVGLVANLAARASHAQQVLEVLNSPSAQRVTLTSTKTPPAPSAHTVYLPERGALVMQASNLKPIPAGKTYELWVIPANGTAPVPAGTFSPDARGFASLVLPKLPPNVAAKAFGITVENAGGATSPTMPIVLSGE